jgi:D-alanyl-D-alanine carboxypeptidase (penicillin-binding protein 5/6)
MKDCRFISRFLLTCALVCVSTRPSKASGEEFSTTHLFARSTREGWVAAKKAKRTKTPGRPKSVAPRKKSAPVTEEKETEKVSDPRDPLRLAARGAIVIDALSGLVLYEKNADARYFPASTTKIITALLVIEGGSLDQEVEVTEEDARVGESSLDIRPGQRFSRMQMLYGLMLKSANDVAHALGRDNGGTMAAFAQKMTDRARELGCTDTHFTNPHGLHHPEHYTTPRDLATITRAAMNQPVFRQLVSTRRAFWINGETTVRTLDNHNRLLDRFPGCIGVKTGYTIPAQQVLASAATRGGREAIAVVMHTDKPGIWEDSTKLLDFALNQAAEEKSATQNP